ncbi:hypothetical protein niasHS_004463 [Heterodera schachtii]|uniref:BTB domain-containing protein n=1 Tax=Heterodera schachtii TaxID=97005 RepID=A0ABD2JJ73_HETSC
MSKTAIAGLKLMLSTGEYADVQFLVGEGDAKELLSAHKLILKLASDVFEAMFRFDAKKEQGENASTNYPAVVEVPDVEAAAFKVMLSFIYTDDLSGLNGDNAMAVLCAAKKYNIPGLVDPSLQIPISELRNVFVAYAYACLFDLEDFANCCLSYIDKNADTLIKSEEFLQIDQKTLCEIFGRDELQIHEEITIWKACRENGIECSAENRRAMLGPALLKFAFRFCQARNLRRILIFTVSSGVLTTQEVIGIQQNNFQPNISQFPREERIWSDGTLLLDIKKVSEFGGEKVGSRRFSETVHIKRLPWKIVAQITTDTTDEGTGNEKWLGIYLLCDAPKEENWRCKCSATFRIISQKIWANNMIGKLCDLIFYNKPNSWSFEFNSNNWGFSNFISFAGLMDQSNGFYNREEDNVTLAIDVTTKVGSANVGQLFELYRKRAAWETDYKIRTLSHDKHTFCNIENSWGFSNFASFAQLMDPSNDFYNQNEDKVTLAIDFTLKDEVPDDVIRVFEFNDHLLRRSVWIEK